jgi:hypothetical protein
MEVSSKDIQGFQSRIELDEIASITTGASELGTNLEQLPADLAMQYHNLLKLKIMMFILNCFFV